MRQTLTRGAIEQTGDPRRILEIPSKHSPLMVAMGDILGLLCPLLVARSVWQVLTLTLTLALALIGR